MNLSFLKNDALQYGSNVTRWPRDRRLAAMVELYRQRNDMFLDALGDLSADALRDQVKIGFEQYATDAFLGAQTLAATLVIWLRDWPADWLSDQIELELPTWQAEREREEWVCELERRADAARECVA